MQYLAPITENGIHDQGRQVRDAGRCRGRADHGELQHHPRRPSTTLLQPIDHVGVLASTEFGDSGFSATAASMNEQRHTGDPDNNDDQVVHRPGRLGRRDGRRLASSVIWGARLHLHRQGTRRASTTWSSPGIPPRSSRPGSTSTTPGRTGRKTPAIGRRPRLGPRDGRPLRGHRAHGGQRAASSSSRTTTRLRLGLTPDDERPASQRRRASTRSRARSTTRSPAT